MKKLVPLIAALSFIAAIPAYAAMHHPMHARGHARHHAMTYNNMAPAGSMMMGNPFRDQDMIISHVTGVRE